MTHYLDLTKVQPKDIYPLSHKFAGKGPDGEISFTNYYMERNGAPFFGVSGECHFSRIHENMWEDTILKMKMGGINIVSTYIFWIHHEEIEGKFRFDGSKNIRKFIELCHKHGLFVIVRMGPFDHGEVRNGGLPDWLYGKPFEVRSLNSGFLDCTRKLYHALAEQFKGLYFKDGGPIIGAQLDNEYMHSAAPWELTTGVSNEWIPGGSDGNAYLLELKKIALDEGIVTPFYTCTGWGGAAAPTEEMLPLWGGYAFWPWIFYDYAGEHPATPEYIYRDYHNNQAPKTYNFEPEYLPEALPYACCEMGGGMSCYYHYRFQLPFESIDAMANIKLAGGCNFLGYYMYRGGSNPKGEKTPYLNECQCPKISYDYQAVIGEFGQIRPSYHRLRCLHSFTKNFNDKLVKMTTVLPQNSQEIDPLDVDTLRYAVRTDGTSGFLFLNNYQDHTECHDKKDEVICLQLPGGPLEIDGISLAAGEEAILPFYMQIEDFYLNYATAQPLSVIRTAERTVYFFFAPEGMCPKFVFDGGKITHLNGQKVNQPEITVLSVSKFPFCFKVGGQSGEVEFAVLSREQSLMFYDVELKGQKTAILSDAMFTCDGNQIFVETPSDSAAESVFLAFPEMGLAVSAESCVMEKTELSLWKGYRLQWNAGLAKEIALDYQQVGSFRYTVEIPKGYEHYKELLLKIDYSGDIGSAYINGELISDNFCNDKTWEIGLRNLLNLLDGQPITILITPFKKDSKVNVSSVMAGRVEETQGQYGGLKAVRLKPVGEEILTIL